MALAGELAKYIGNEMIKTGRDELAKAGAKSALSSLIPSVATKARTATLGGLMPKVATSGFSPTVVPELERKIAVKSKDSILNSVIPVKTGAYRLNQLRDAYEEYVGFKKNNIEKYDKFIDTLDKSDPLAMSQKSYDEIIGKILGQDTYNSMMNIKNYAAITSPEKFDKSKASMKSFLASDKSEKIRSISQKLYPVGTKVYRYKNSPDGISYTNSIENALKNNASNDVDDMENIEEYMLKEGDRIIAPEFVERGNTGAPGSEFIVVKKEDLPKGRGWWRNNQNNPHVAKPIRDLTDKDAETLYKYTKKMPDLSDDAIDLFPKSVIRDKDGKPKKMYHGSPNGQIKEFYPGSYFTENKAYADGYQNPEASSLTPGSKKIQNTPRTYEVYLNIEKPFTLSDKRARDIYFNEYIKGGNSMYYDPYGTTQSMIDGLEEVDWTEGVDLMEWLQENHPEYDGMYVDEGGTGGYSPDNEYVDRGISVVNFRGDQVKILGDGEVIDSKMSKTPGGT